MRTISLILVIGFALVCKNLTAQNEQIYHVDFKVKGSQYAVYDRSGTEGMKPTWVHQDGKMSIGNKTIHFGTGSVTLNQDDWIVCGPFDLTKIDRGGFLKFITSRSWGSNKLSVHVSKTFNPDSPSFTPVTWREVSVAEDFPPNKIDGVNDIHHYDIGTYNISSRLISLYRYKSATKAYVAFRYLCNASGTHDFNVNDLEIVGSSLSDIPRIMSQRRKIQVEKNEQIKLSLNDLILSETQEEQVIVFNVLDGDHYSHNGNTVVPDSDVEENLAINVNISVDGVSSAAFKIMAEVFEDIKANKIKQVQSRIARMLSVKNDISLEEAVTTQWSGDGSFKDVTTDAMRRQALYGRMAAMANAWYRQQTITSNETVIHPEELKVMIYKALLYYCKNPAAYSFPNGAFNDPDYFGGIGVLLFDAIQEDKNKPELSALLSELSEELHKLNKQVYLSGGSIKEDILIQNDGPGGLCDHQRQGNLGYRLGGMLAACVATGNTESMDWLANHCRLQVPYVINKPDYHPVGNSVDGSLFQHNGGGAQVYWSGYGVNWTLAMLSYQEATANTPWEYSIEDMEHTADMFANGMVWSYYKGHFPFNITGRGQATPGSNLGWSSYITKQCTYLANSVNNKSGTVLKEYINAVRDNDVIKSHIVDSAKYFQNGEFMIHRTANVQYCVKLLSNRSAGPESSTAMNKKGFLLGDGSTFINRGALDHQYSRAIWNWQAIPGVTAEQRAFPLEYYNRYVTDWGRRGNSMNDFAGGVTNGKTGVCGFEYRRAYDATYDYYPVEVEKGYFFNGDNMVALGAGINRREESGSGADIWTTIDQKDFGNKFIAKVGNDKVTVIKDFFTATSEYVKTSDEPIWFWHDNVGYIIYPKEGESVEVAFGVKKEQGNWQELSDGNSDEPAEADVVYFAINHGAFPDQSTYNYQVLGDISESEMEAFANNYNVEIIENTSDVQAISWNNGQSIQMIFYTSGSVNLDDYYTLSVDKPAIVMANKEKDGHYTIHLSDPLQLDGNTITLAINGAFYSDNWQVVHTNGLTSVPVSMPSGIYVGASVSGIIQLDTSTDLKKLETSVKNKFTVFPNPVTEDKVTILCNEDISNDIIVDVFDVAGSIIKSLTLTFSVHSNKWTVSLDDIKSGSYIFNFKTKEGIESHKILVFN